MRNTTRKDVLYALEFGGERLIKTFVPGGGRNPDEYSLSGTGMKVDRGLARDILADPRVVPMNDGLLPDMSQSFGWRRDAV